MTRPLRVLAGWLIAVSILAVGALAGCIDAGGPPTDPRDVGGDDGRGYEPGCAPGSGQPSGNAPLLEGLDREPLALARALAEAVEDPLASEEPFEASDGRLTWDTEGDGKVTYSPPWRSWNSFGHLQWRGEDRWTLSSVEDAREEIRDVLEGLGVDRGLELRAGWNTPDEREAVWFAQDAGETGGMIASHSYGDSFSLDGLHDLSQASQRVSVSDAEDRARVYLRCVLDDHGKTTEAGYELESSRPDGASVERESLAYRVYLRYSEPEPHSHCGFQRYVFVDAETGAVLGHDTPTCA